MDQQTYERKKSQAYTDYKCFESVYCPYFKRSVILNSNGFWHIVYKNGGKTRDQNAQLLRFKLLPKALDLLKITTTLQEYDSVTKEIFVKDHAVRIPKIVKIEYFGFIAILDTWKIKVIVQQQGNGAPFFWSVIPNWVTNKKRDTTKNFQNFKGNLEED